MYYLPPPDVILLITSLAFRTYSSVAGNEGTFRDCGMRVVLGGTVVDNSALLYHQKPSAGNSGWNTALEESSSKFQT